MEQAAAPSQPDSTPPDGCSARNAGKPKVAVVILNWNDGAATLACLEALQATDYPNYSVVVVDNGSVDGSVQRIRDHGYVDLVINPSNLGYTGGVNAGISRALACGADYIWLLNSDAVTRPDVLHRLVEVAEKDEAIGLVSPVFHDPDHPARAEFYLGRFDPASRHTAQTADPATALAWQQDHVGQLVLLGTALLIRRRLVEVVGLLDDAFFAYVEDVDYCLRAQAAGFRPTMVTEAIVLHKFKQPIESPGTVPAYLHYFITRNYLLLWRKLPGPWLFRRAFLWFLHQRLSQISRMTDIVPAVDAVLAGLWDGLRGVGGPYRPDRRAPWLLRAIMGRHPGIWLAILDGRSFFRRTTF